MGSPPIHLSKASLALVWCWVHHHHHLLLDCHPVVAQIHSRWHFGWLVVGWLVGWRPFIPSLLLGAKERGALRTRGVVLVEELVELVEVGGGAAVDVVPPVADEVLLVEHGPVRAEEAVEVAVRLAHVEHLQERRQEERILATIFCQLET